MSMFFLKNKLTKYYLPILFSLILIPVSLFSSQFKTSDDLIVSDEEIIDDDLYLFGNYVECRGRINGDLTAFCYDISANGDVDGNVNLWAYNTDLIGKVSRSARIFGYKIRINGPIYGNLLLFGNEVKIGSNAVIGRDLTFGCASMKIEGTINGNVKGAGDKVIISGIINGDLDIQTGDLMIISPAEIKGNLKYTSQEEAIIDDDVIITGKVSWEKPAEKVEEDSESFLWTIMKKFIFFIMALVTGLVLIMLFKNHTRESSDQIEKRFWVNLAIGCLSFIILTGGAIIPAILIIGIPISVMMIFLGLVLFYIGKVYTAIALGRLTFGLVRRGNPTAIGLELLLGLMILSILFVIPYIGWITYIVAFILGTGAAVSGFMSLSRKYKAAAQ